MTHTLGLYIHVPFCRSRCRYCGFYSAAAMPGASFIAALLREMEMYAADFKNVSVDTVYFGGGTPSQLSSAQLAKIFAGLRKNFSISETAEITMEMNPCDMTEAYLANALACGVNRLSVGVQAKQDFLLRAIGRLHTAKEAERAVRLAHRTGFQNISVDLMYELPRQTPADFTASLRWVMHLPITHLSVYSLILEEGTAFTRLAAAGKLPRPTEAESWAMYQAMCRVPPHYGFHRYEISSFARAGYESRHNEKYWRLDPYLGLGPAAASRVGRRRFTNRPGTRRYERALLMGEPAPKEIENLSEADEMEEYCFLHLRMARGIPLADFSSRYGAPITKWYGEKISWLKKNRLLTEADGHLFLTPRGMAMGNTVFEQFLR